MTFKEYKERLDKFFNDYPELHDSVIYTTDYELEKLNRVEDNGIISSVFMSPDTSEFVYEDEIEEYLNDKLGESPDDLDFERERECQKERDKLQNSLTRIVVIN